MNPLTVDEVMRRHVAFEQECIAQAKAELANELEGDPYQPRSGMAFLRRVIRRAQQIKEQRKANGEQTC